jgi:macrolide transport system ATP-binding/permease protein
MSRQKRMLNDLEQDIRDHIEIETRDNIARGMPPDEARYTALRKFGNMTKIKEETREVWTFVWLEQLMQDIGFGLRMLRKSPGFTAVAVLTLALGIGANTAIFSLVDSALLRSLPVSDPHNLMLLEWTAHSSPAQLNYSNYGDCDDHLSKTSPIGCSFSEPMFNDIRTDTNVFSAMAAFAGGDRLDLSGNGAASTVENPEYISGDYFQTLGVRPFLGRLIASADDTPSASPVVVLSHNYWRSNFGGSTSAVGKTILLNKVPFTIVGIADQQFDALSPGNPIQLWLPLSALPRINVPWDNRDADFNYWWLVIVGRLKAGTSRAQAQAAVSTLFRNEVTHSAKPMLKSEDAPAISLLPAQKGLTGDTSEISAPIYVLMLAVGVVLLIACANVAGLLLSRASARQKEFALRFALGARRARVVRQLLTESLLLSAAGGALGIVFASWGAAAIAAFVNSSQDNPSALNPGIDGRVLAFTAAASILTGILFGLAPALRGLRADLIPALKEGSDNSASPARRIARWLSAANALAVSQVALTMIVLVAAGLLVRTLQNLKSLDPGFDTRNILTFRIDPTLIGYKRADTDSFYKDLQSRLGTIPGVKSVSYSWLPLLGGGLWTTGFHLPGTPENEVSEADELPVGADFFNTMRIPLRLGREFTPADFAEAERVEEVLAEENERVAAGVKGPRSAVVEQNKNAAVGLPPMPAIVNDSFVRKYFSKTNPIGLRFGSHGTDESNSVSMPGWEIVGVVGDAKYNKLRRDVAPTLYVPTSGRATSFTLRTGINPSSLVPQIRAVVSQMDDNLPVFSIRTETEQIERQLFVERLVARLSSFFGLLALVLACIGLYGLLSYEVTRRTREIGIRMALGAQQSEVLRLVIGQGIALAAIGAAIGAAAALGITRFLGSLLFNVKAADPLTFVGVAALLAAVAALACYIPAVRAARVDPMVALRYE